MILTQPSDPRVETIRRTRTVNVKPARLLDVDTGRKRVVTELNEQGEEVAKELPIYEKRFEGAESMDIDEDVQVWVVETSYNGLTERHEFASEEAAKLFRKGFN